MGSKKCNSQLSDALRAAGLKPTKKNSSSKIPEKKPSIKSRQTVIGDLLGSGHENNVGRELRGLLIGGAENKRSNGSATSNNIQVSAAKTNVDGPAQYPPVISLMHPHRLVKRGSFRPHPLLDPSGDASAILSKMLLVGHEKQIAKKPADATTFVIGLDFGTSATKVVLRDIYRDLAFPVPFYACHKGVEQYLLSSGVYRTGTSWSLIGGKQRMRDLKLRLLKAQDEEAGDEFNDCCAFLALVIRRCRAWLLSEHGKEYSKHEIEWRLNLGIAARSYEDRRTVLRFRRLAWAAANIAAQVTTEVSYQMVDAFRLRSRMAIEGDVQAEGDEFRSDQIDVVPEISAQLQGFMRSARWDWSNRPIMMLVDIGAGTVDSALFSVKVHGTSSRLTFFSNRVDQNGVINLHRNRLVWLEEAARLSNAEKAVFNYLAAESGPTDRLRPIPESVCDYVPGYFVECEGLDADAIFLKERYRLQVAGCIQDARVGKGLTSNDLKRMPLLLCGGGSRMDYFSQVTDIINATPGWSFKVEKQTMPVPEDLADFGMNSNEFDRISVAYGLSLVGNVNESIGEVIRAIEVPPLRPLNSNVVRNRPEIISKDQM